MMVIKSGQAIGLNIVRFFELSWLNPRGKPQIAVLEFVMDAQDKSKLDSKILKEYLNNLAMTRFETLQDVELDVQAKISQDTGVAIEIRSIPLEQFAEIEVDDQYLLSKITEVYGQAFISYSVRFICQQTSQPFSGSIVVGAASSVDMTSVLLKYRNHEYTQEEYAQHVYGDLCHFLGTNNVLMSLHIARRGGFSWQFLRAQEDVNFKRYITRSIVE